MAQELGVTKKVLDAKIIHLRNRGKLPFANPKKHVVKSISGLDVSELKVGETYKAINHQPYHGVSKCEGEFEGEAIQITKRLIVLKCKLGYCESYLLSDIKIGSIIMQGGKDGNKQ